jgi:hypothetical protein
MQRILVFRTPKQPALHLWLEPNVYQLGPI